MLPPMFIFSGKTDQAIRNLNILVKTHEKTWMDNDLNKTWVEEIWLKHTQVECKRLGFQNSMFTFDAFDAHFSDGVKKSIIRR